MAVNYAVQAEVIDIQSDRPGPSDAMLVDSNVWFWMTYSGAGLGNEWQARIYPPYVKRARAAKARLFRCGLSMAELAHGIERAELDIFRHTHPNEKPKEFRHNYTVERRNIVTDVQNSWRLVKTMASPLNLLIDEPATDRALARFETEKLDGHDLFLIQVMAASGVTQVLTDDGDYCTVPGIRVFTANRPVLAAARAQGRLVTR